MRTARRAREHINSEYRDIVFVPMEDSMREIMASSSFVLTGIETSLTIVRASARARLKACIITTGWMLRSSCGRA